ncbi:MAG TPA: hypothetical protein VHA56_19850 [Mucilaginibacter sp.]|nr:hypothetical protein [Mucilaginibacter sp.]
MEKFEVLISKGKQSYTFEVRDYLHHTGDSCKFEIYLNGAFAGGFEPDGHRGLHLCKNPGLVSEAVLHIVAERLEPYVI